MSKQYKIKELLLDKETKLPKFLGTFFLDFKPYVGYTYFGAFPVNNPRKFILKKVIKYNFSNYDYDYLVHVERL